MALPYELLIFDWDGTLMDSQAHIVASMCAAMDALAIERLDQARICNVIGLGLREAVRALFPDRHTDEAFVTAFVRHYQDHYFASQVAPALFSHSASTLRALQTNGYRLAVATSKSRVGLDRALSETGLQGLFESTRTADETASKPDPRMLREILAECHVASHQAIMIGDTEYDMAMARDAGAHAIAVSYGVHAAQRLQRYRPLTCLDDIAELSTWLRRTAAKAECVKV